jgi:hypothetical protein
MGHVPQQISTSPGAPLVSPIELISINIDSLNNDTNFEIPEVDADDFVLEWDLCLDDCPHEDLKVSCTEDPEFPLLMSMIDSRHESKYPNFSTSYERGIDLVTADLDYVAFECPLGYVFTNTTESSVYAICHNWTWCAIHKFLIFNFYSDS